MEGDGGPIQIPPTGGAIEIAGNGEVRVGSQLAGKLRLVTFADPTGLRRLEGAALDAGGMQAEDVTSPSMKQGFVEMSNVDPMREMTAMITHFRLFESQQKSLTTQDGLLGSVVRDLGKF